MIGGKEAHNPTITLVKDGKRKGTRCYLDYGDMRDVLQF